MADTAESRDHVLTMIFPHGDYDSAGSLCIGVDLFTNDDWKVPETKSCRIYSLRVPRHHVEMDPEKYRMTT